MIKEKDTIYTARWAQLSGEMSAQKIDYWFQPITDEFQGEYPADYAQRLTWLCGFTGSAGVGLFAKEAAPQLFVDGRYTVQAKQEVPAGMQVHLISDFSPTAWLKQQDKTTVIGIDPWLHSMQQVASWQALGATIMPIGNAVDAIWQNQPDMPNAPVAMHSLSLAGEEAQAKIQHVQDWLVQENCDALLTTAPDAVMWLLNVRGADIPYNPLALSYALIQREGPVQLYLAARDMDMELSAYFEGLSVSVIDIASLFDGAHNPFTGLGACAVDPSNTPFALGEAAKQAQCRLFERADPIIAAKAIKNEVELEAMRDAHLRDGLAVCKFLHWFYQQEHLDELQAIDALEGFRREDATYRQPSFPTIAGAGSNGAIVHYRASERSNRALNAGELLLVDSGGQYAGGTTDITRTLVMGTPSADQIAYYTRVLKGHIAISMARFPAGTNGGQLDPLARQHLWQIGADYNHGTGHGVGAYLCVHEGPQGISKRMNDVALKPGMILSNEPGYYREGAFGIRIENLIEIESVGVSHEGVPVLGSRPLTVVPYNRRLIDPSMLSANETEWLNGYHAAAYERMLKAGASGALAVWLKQETAAI